MRTSYFIILLTVLLGACYALHLDYPAKEYYDEVYHVKTAREFLTLSGNTDTVHPPLAKILIAVCMRLFGDKPCVWRLVSFTSGIGVGIVFFLLALKLFRHPGWAFAAALLFALDGIALTQARIAMHNSLMLFWMLLGTLFFIKILESAGRDWKAFLGCGISIGLTAATRWVGLGILPVMGLLLAGHFNRIKWDRKLFQNIFLFLFFVPLVVYFSTHLILPFIKGYRWTDIWKYQIDMLHYHASLKATHTYGSQWWSWPLMIRPIWYLFERANGIVFGILCIGNPAMLWMGVPALGYLAWDFFKNKCRMSGFVLAGFLSQWLPWAFIGRVKFFHYYYPATPFLALAVTLFFRDIWNTGNTGKILALGYALLVIGMFVYWYPLWTGLPISEVYFQNHLWFTSWI